MTTTPTPTTRVLLAPTLELALTTRPDVTIEAEFGSHVMCGSQATFAHVPSAAHNPAPCADPDVDGSCPDGGVILLSHLDLDSIGGALRAMVACPAPWATFWTVAGAIDVRGPHRIDAAIAHVQATSGITSAARPTPRFIGHDALPMAWTDHQTAEVVTAIRAFWAWARSRPRLPRDVVTDVTAEVLEAGRVLDLLISNDPGEEAHALRTAGQQALAAEDAQEAASLRRVVQHGSVRIAVREADHFVAHLHRAGADTNIQGTVSRDTRSGAITIAVADPIPGVSCAAVARSLWGPTAGGHAGIAGSPRGQVMPIEDLDRAATALAEAILSPNPAEGTNEHWIPAWEAGCVQRRHLSPALHAAVTACPRTDADRVVHVVREGGDLIVQSVQALLRPTNSRAPSATVTREIGRLPVAVLPIPSWALPVTDDPSATVEARWLTPDEARAALADFHSALARHPAI